MKSYLIEFKEGKHFEQIVRMLDKTKTNCKILLSGPSGCGKTFFIKNVAKDLGLTVVEPNPEDSLKKIYQMTQLQIKPTLFLFENANEIKDIKNLEKILTESNYPCILIVDEEWKVKPSIRNRCTSYKARKPKLETIVKFIKEEAKNSEIQPDFTKITAQDFRTAYNQAFYNSSSFEIKNKFEQVNDLFMLKETGADTELSWLLGNVEKFYHGRQLYEQINLIADSDKIKDVSIMKYGHKSYNTYNKAETPYYIKRKAIFRSKEKWEARG